MTDPNNPYQNIARPPVNRPPMGIPPTEFRPMGNMPPGPRPPGARPMPVDAQGRPRPAGKQLTIPLFQVHQ
jgi:hypothetical protein